MHTIQELERGIEAIIPADGLRKKIQTAQKENRPLRVKFGMDPTAPDLHLGHAVCMKKIRQFMENDYEIHLIIGNFTSLIGDPSGRNTTRPPLTAQEVQKNAETYIQQLGKIFDTSKIHVHYNNDWLGSMTLADVLKLMSQATLSQIMQREDFAKRFEENASISLHELLYPLMQGYDSVQIKADIEFGGRDQLLNCLFGRTLQENVGQDPQIIVAMPLLCGLDGHIKMSKSKGNYIGLTESPEDMFGKTMSIPDSLLPEWIDLTTEFSPEEKANMIADLKNNKVNPMELKKAVAFDIVRQYHSKEAAEKAQDFFYHQVQQKGMETKEFKQVSLTDLGLSLPVSLVDVAVAVEPQQSKSAVRRLIESGAVSIDGQKVTDINEKITAAPVKIKIGKRGFYEIV